VSFEVDPGECLLVIGPSGSGKSTLALALAGLVPRELPGEWQGSLLVDGLDPTHATGSEIAARVGLVFQDAASQLVMERVEDDVAFGLESRAWSRDTMLTRVPETLDQVGLTGLERRRTSRLSGGQQQRLAMAGAVAPRPGILVLDEPTANLDPPAARAFAARMTALRAARAVTMVLVEHRVDIAWSLADRVLALGPDGRPIDFGAPAAVLTRSRDRLLAAGAWLPDEPAAMRQPPIPVASSLTSDPVVVTARGVRFAYDGPDVIQGVDLAVAAGERTVIVGTNGSGKSTLGRLLVGLLRPSRGQVRLDGHDPSRLSPPVLAQHAAYLFQDPEQQFVTLRVADEVTLGLDQAARRNAEALMDRIDLPLALFGDRSPYTLSGGEQRRLSLATALVRHPRLLVLDEPTFGQDRRGHEALLQILAERVDGGAAVLAATHDERFIDAFATRVLRVEEGRIVAVSGASDAAGPETAAAGPETAAAGPETAAEPVGQRRGVEAFRADP
jgi:energy-coupling factor transporter ATP-binding protein EcfA2